MSKSGSTQGAGFFVCPSWKMEMIFLEKGERGEIGKGIKGEIRAKEKVYLFSQRNRPKPYS